MQTSPLLPRRRLWSLFLMPVLVLVLAVAWSGFWFYAASQVDEKFDVWRGREAKSGRVYECADRSVAGFPFRLEVRCGSPVVTLTSQTSDPTQLTAKLRDILVIAQVYDPAKIIAEFTGPVEVNSRGETPSFVGNWTTGRASAALAGLPPTPQRISMEFDDPQFDRVGGAVQTPLLRAKHLELHMRLLDGAPAENPVIDTAIQLEKGSILGLHPLLTEPFEADLRARLSGLKNFDPKPWPARFREIAAASGRLDFSRSRFQQGDTVAVAAGSLGITPTGYLDGELTMTVSGLERVIGQLGIDGMLGNSGTESVNKAIGALDRMIPGLGNVARKNAGAGIAAGVNMLGQATTLDGKPARVFPLKFAEGAVMIGPLKIAQTPQLF